MISEKRKNLNNSLLSSSSSSTSLVLYLITDSQFLLLTLLSIFVQFQRSKLVLFKNRYAYMIYSYMYIYSSVSFDILWSKILFSFCSLHYKKDLVSFFFLDSLFVFLLNLMFRLVFSSSSFFIPQVEILSLELCV